MDEEILSLEIKGKMVNLRLLPFDGDVNVEEILKIDYSNILGECLTWNVVANRLANLRSEIESIVKEQKFGLEILEAQLKEDYRFQLDGKNGKKVTVDEVASAVLRDESYQKRKKFVLAREKEFSYLDNLYWSAKTKSDLLQKLSDKMVPTDFSQDLLEGTVNGIMIKMSKKAIK